jgi:hypothetical protein
LNWSLLARIAIINAILLALTYLVYQDILFRDRYAHQLNFSPSTSYSALSHVVTLTEGTTVLSSPLTLDWPQLLVLAWVAIDVLYVVEFVRKWSSSRRQATPPASS